MRPHPSEAVLSFWFGTLDEHGVAEPSVMRRWFTKDPAFDAEIRARFTDTHRALQEGDSLWRAPLRHALARVIVLDQFSRNMFRDTPKMFASDEAALATAREWIERGEERALATQERVFLCMPFMHSERLEDQERSVRLFTLLAEDAPLAAKEAMASNVGYAIRHRDIVARFGRFPHRNAIVGRASTAEEATFLLEPGSSF